MKESLIGKFYLPSDNSYSVNLTSSSNNPYENDQLYLAGTFNTNAKLCTIVSEPFMCYINTSIGTSKLVEMILVEYDGQTSSILYYEKCVQGHGVMDNGIPMIWEDEG